MVNCARGDCELGGGSPVTLASADTSRPKVLVSYSRADKVFADELVDALEYSGFEVTIDRQSIMEGEDWKLRLGELIADADTVVFLLSSDSAESPICAWEVTEAQRMAKRILPVLCRPLAGVSPPAPLSALNYVRFDEPHSFMKGLRALVRALNSNLDWLREHTRLLGRAREWESAGRPQNRLLSGSDIDDARAWALRRPNDAPELTQLHFDFIRMSEHREAEKASAERKRLEEMAVAQTEREHALRAAELAQLEKAKESRRVVKRTVAGLIVAVTFALAASFAGIYAFHKKNEAQERAAEARNRLHGVIEAAHGFAAQTASLARQTGIPAKTVIRLLEQAESALLKLNDEGVDDPLLFDRIGTVWLEFARSYRLLGNRDAWWSRTDETVALMRRQLRVHPADVMLSRGLGIALHEMGETYRDKGDAVTAMRILHEAIEVQNKLTILQPENAQLNRELASTYSTTGSVALLGDDFEDSLANFKDALRIRTRIVELEPENKDALLEMSIAQIGVGVIYHEHDDYATAIEIYGEARKVREFLCDMEPNNPTFRRYLSWALSSEGEALQESGQYEVAIEKQMRALALRQQNLSEDGSNELFKRDVAWAYFSLSEAHRMSNHGDLAEHDMREAIKLFRSLHESNRDDDGKRRNLGWSLRWLARMLTQRAAYSEAKDSVDEARELLESVSDRERTNMQWRYEFAAALSDCGYLHFRMGQTQVAESMYAQSRAVFNEVPNKRLMRAEKRKAGDELQGRIAELENARALINEAKH